MKVVTTLSNEQEAYMFRDALQAQGIEAFVQNEGTGYVFNGFAFADNPVAVKDEDYPKAMKIWEEYRKNLGEE